ncbi:MAG TPA: GIY-YIG nuclease family protein [Candidatus Elarobacter sp.]|jgi:predicted GIY-YIG superfamily endonuclease
MKTYWVYVLECSDGHYYVGVTSQLEVRLAEHQSGIDPWCYTFGRRPVRLVHSTPFLTPYEAISAEKRLKGWCRAKKEALIRGDWPTIQELARNYGDRAAEAARNRAAPPDVTPPRPT